MAGKALGGYAPAAAEAAPPAPAPTAVPDPAPVPAPVKPPAFDSTEAFAKLPPEQQLQVKAFHDTAAAGADEQAKAALNQDLTDMLADGRLLQKDFQGKTTLERLAPLTTGKLNGNLASLEDKGAVARDILHNIAHPEVIGQGEGTSACAQATLEATLAYDQPADYARIAVQLATRGYAEVPGHASQDPEGGGWKTETRLELPNLPPEYASGRNPVSYAMQSAFRDYVAQKNFDYEGGFSIPMSFAAGKKSGPKESLTGNQVKLLYDGIVGEDHTLVYANPGTDVTRSLDKALENVKKEDAQSVVKVTMKNPDGSLHSIAVTDITEAGVTYWDPATRTLETVDAKTFNSQVDRILLDPSLKKELNVGNYWFGFMGGIANGGFRLYGSSDPDSGFVDADEGGGRGGKSAVAS